MPSPEDRRELHRSEPIVLHMDTTVDENELRRRLHEASTKVKQIERQRIIESLTEDELRDELAKRDMQIVALTNEEAEVERMQRELLSTTDAMTWAEEFCRTLDGHLVTHHLRALATTVDTGTMVAWFATAIETGRAQGRRELCPHTHMIELDDDLSLCRECGIDKRSIVPPVDLWPPEAIEKMIKIARAEAAAILDERLGGDGR